MARAKRRRDEGGRENLERWLVSYADFITLMFAFFVVMYAISQVNEGKYRVLSDTLSSAFRSIPGTASGAMVAVNSNMPAPGALPLRKPPSSNLRIDEKVLQQNKEKLRNVAKNVNEALAPLVREGQVRVSEGALGITIDINANVLFAPGDARLGPEAVRALLTVAQILVQTDFPITVEGHTDNTPINTPQFPSNWELSGIRASTVVRLFVEAGVDPRRLTATGYADQRPIADNATPEGKALNRRVAITIESRASDNPIEIKLPD